MVDLTTTYLGLKLRNPLVVSASPLQEDVYNIRRMVEAGASAVVLPSLFEEQLVTEQHELHFHTTYGTESFAEALSYFPDEQMDFKTGPELYLNLIVNAKRTVDVPIIASLNGSTRGGWTQFAAQMQEAGADALELNIYTLPTDLYMSGAEVEQNYVDIVRAVKKAVTIPVAVKVGPFFSNMANMARQLVDVGADGLVLFNRFYQPDLDIEELEVKRNLLLSTPAEMRLPLTWIGILYGRLQVDFAATTGIDSATDAIKLLMAGANVTMMASALYRHGINHIRSVEADMRQWLEERDYQSVTQLRGSMSQIHSPNPSAFERAQYVQAVSNLPDWYR